MKHRADKENPNRKIVAIIDCDISDRDICSCEVDENAHGSCGNRADYCMWANWRIAKVTEYGKKKGYGRNKK